MEDKIMKPVLAVLVVAAVVSVLPARAQDTSTPLPYAKSTPGQATNAADIPGLGEVMTLQQLRHIKLWFAGEAGNWPLANYEIGELQEGFDDINKLVGGGTVDKEVGAPIKALQKVIDRKDHEAFPAAFDKLSAGCNSCHHLLDHAFISIQRPASLPYSDQSFAPQR
jgi:hypothetical protein